jgi:hypothetical protein
MDLLQDDVEIFARLEAAGRERFDVTAPRVIDYEWDDAYFLLLFNPTGNLKGCKLYSVPASDAKELEVLLVNLLQLPEDEGYDRLKTEALLRVENRIASGRYSDRFFDAH